MRKILPLFILLLSLLCAFCAQAEEEMICPQSVRITAQENGEYRLSFDGDLEVNERWVWFACPDKDSAEDLMGVMRDAIEDKTPARGLTFDYMFKIWPIHGSSGIPDVKVPADSGYVFYGKAYCDAHAFDREQGLFMITLGGTNLNKIGPGETGGNDLMNGGAMPPETGDPVHPLLLALLLAASSLGIVLPIKRNRKNRAVR